MRILFLFFFFSLNYGFVAAEGYHLSRSSHFNLQSNAPVAELEKISTTLEETCTAWSELFGGKVPANQRFSTIVFKDQKDFAAVIKSLKINAKITPENAGYYSQSRKTTFSYLGSKYTWRTIRHETIHQMFAETRPANQKPVGMTSDCWLIEGVAMLFEFLNAEKKGGKTVYTLGGTSSARLRGACYRRLVEGFYIPLEKFVTLGQKEFYKSKLLPKHYSQAAGLSDFFFNGQKGKYRAEFVKLVGEVYAGKASSSELPKRLGKTFAQLDSEYLEYLEEMREEILKKEAKP